MIIKRPNELRNYITEREQFLKTRGRMSVELKNHDDSQKQTFKRQSMPLLDSKKIKSRLSQIFKQENQSKQINKAFQHNEKNKKQNFRQYFSKTFLRRRQKGESFHHLTKEKMQILGDEYEKQAPEPAFKVKEIKIRRKGSPFTFNSEKQSVEEIYADRYYRVLTFAKSKFKQDKLTRKPSIPQSFKINQSKQVPNNFLNTRNKLSRGKAEEKIGNEPLEPWGELDDLEINQYDNCI